MLRQDERSVDSALVIVSAHPCRNYFALLPEALLVNPSRLRSRYSAAASHSPNPDLPLGVWCLLAPYRTVIARYQTQALRIERAASLSTSIIGYFALATKISIYIYSGDIPGYSAR
jgi:hypothetical protein